MITTEEMDYFLDRICGYLGDDSRVPDYVVDSVEKIIRRIVSEQKDMVFDKALQRLMQRILVLEKKIQNLEEN